MKILKRAALVALVSLCALTPLVSRAETEQKPSFDHVYVIVLENHSFDDALFGPASFLRGLAQKQGLATFYFGVTHPSLPNYLAMVAGDDFGIRANRPSCFASDLPDKAACHAPEGRTIVDQLEEKGLTWALYAGDLPQTGSLVMEAPSGESRALYVQKHNPFAYFRQIAGNAARRAMMKPLGDLDKDLSASPPNFAFIVPNQCNDGHGLAVCPDASDLATRFDRFAETIVEKIRSSRAWTGRSAIFITFDEGLPPRSGGPKYAGCCGDSGGHHVATIVVSKCGKPVRSAKALDHYSLLATIEDGFGLPRLAKAADADTLSELVGDRC